MKNNAAILFMILFASLGLSEVATASTWSQCALEKNPALKCNFVGRHKVRYGIPSKYITKIAENGVLCEDASFSAPTTTYQNTCWVNSAITTAAVTVVTSRAPASVPTASVPMTSASWSQCALENDPAQKCSFSGRREVRYGIPSNFITKVAENSVLCEDASFSAPTTTYQNTCWVSSLTTTAAISVSASATVATAAPASTPVPAPAPTPVPAPAAVPAPAPAPITTGAAGPRVSSFANSGPITATAGQIISGVHIENPNGPCITINAPNVVVRDSDIGPCNGGGNIVIGSGGDNAVIEFNRITDGVRGVYTQSTTNVTTRKNYLEKFDRVSGGGAGSAIEYDYMNTGLVDSNVIRGSNYPSDVVSAFESSGMRYLNNDIDVQITEPSAAGFTMGDMRPGAGNDPGHDNYMTGNIVHQRGGVPAGVFGSSGNTIIEKNCLSAGIQAYNYSGIFTGVTIRNNVINIGASFVPNTSILNGWSTNIDSTDCSLVPQ